MEVINGFTDDPIQAAKLGLANARKAIDLDDSFADGYWVAGAIHAHALGETEKAVPLFERAIALNPNHADLMADWGGFVLPKLGRGDEGISILKQAMRLSPFHADWYDQGLVLASFYAQRYEDAVSAFGKVEYPFLPMRFVYLASLAHAGRSAEATAATAAIRELRPDVGIADIAGDPMSVGLATMPGEAMQRLLDGLRKAGFPG